MPKASKPRTTKARSGPLALAETDVNTTKRPSNGTKKEEAVEKTKKPEKKAVESYLLLVHLTDTEDPVISRFLSVPSDLTFEDLHHVLQIAFGWAGCHAHSFTVSKLLEEGERPSWLTGSGMTLLHLLPDDDMKDMFPDPETIKKTTDYKLSDIYDTDEYRGKVDVTYEYDHGDSWGHQIAFLGRTDPNLRKVMKVPDDLEVFCLGGEGHPCAEDAGGIVGWEDLKKVFKKRSDPDGRKNWYKTICANGDPKGLDPWKWSVFDVNDELAERFDRGTS